jgi:hypothetical protein
MIGIRFCPVSAARARGIVAGRAKATTARYGQFKDKNYYLYLLDTLDYHLRWGNYSANIRPAPDHQGVARLSLENLDQQ